MGIFDGVHRMLHKMVVQFPLVDANPVYNPRMVQRPLIDAGNTGRYALDAFQVKMDAPARGTLFAGTFRHTGLGSPDVTAQHAAVYGGMGQIPLSVPGSQGLVQGLNFRDDAL